MGRDSSVGIVTGYWLDDRGVGFRVSVRATFFCYVVPTGSGALLAFYPMSTGVFIPGCKAVGA
jgi:hypothetical protein